MIILVLLIMMTMGKAKNDMEKVVMEMKTDMNEHFVLMEEKQMKTQDDCKKN